MLLALLIPACSQQNIVEEVDFAVRLDKENTYRTGEPVRFNLTGNTDYMVFYSGEEGHEYKYKDRSSIPPEDLLGLELEMEYRAQYGVAGGLDVYISDQFPGLAGNDGDADRAAVKQMVEGGMKGWTKLPYEEGMGGSTGRHTYDVKAFAEKFSIAFHWHPTKGTDGFKDQRSYYVTGLFKLQAKGSMPTVSSMNKLDFVSLVMNEEDDPYLRFRGDTTYNGTVRFNDPSGATIKFQGCENAMLPYNIDQWVISRSSALNQIPSDEGQRIKNMLKPLASYTYVYEKPGLYTATFVGVNSNYQGHREAYREVKVLIVDNKI